MKGTLHAARAGRCTAANCVKVDINESSPESTSLEGSTWLGASYQGKQPDTSHKLRNAAVSNG